MLKNLVITFARGANGKVSYSSAMLFGGGHLTTTPCPYPFQYEPGSFPVFFKATRCFCRAKNNFRRVSGHDDRPKSFYLGHVSFLVKNIR